ncbi:pre-mRNA-processing factor 19-like [Sycon ciliatum]|uniref:pre-mRNA-processing factor 19-like n=1 Tax=Sycon ciliatum TaxID=27933 RepID=UPI0020AB2FA1|eukprot:scpid49124/ scgid26128/ Pre-mRNA-processing factor 19; Nuclear matrix protein 200; PRP19/PSO4 homolog; Senescence evasion factor &gt; Pre-mRNA-processing factor 19; Neuronal differentiation-related gene protein; PRP19/PSO4 homolog
MELYCSLSNVVPEHPVLSPVSGCVFERRLIEKYVGETGNDPVNSQPLTLEQLIDIKTSPVTRPRPPSATSIPAILKLLQDEWDAEMLHSFTLRQQLQTARQELSHALYQHDTACRVIARLTKEVTAAREALATLKSQAGYIQAAPQAATAVAAAPADVMMADEAMDDGLTGPTEMTEEIIERLQETAAKLTAERKKRGKKPPEGLASIEELSAYKQTSTHPGLHSASVPGILSLSVNERMGRIATGGADKNVVVFERDTEQIVCTLKGHTKKVTSVVYHTDKNVVFSASPDATIRMWTVANSHCQHVIKAHDGPVTGLSLQATGDYLLSCSTDQHWAFSDVTTGRVLAKVTDPSINDELTCAQFHPDGLLFGTGSKDSVVKIWDLKEKANVANFPGHSGPITDIAFSENGYFLATAADDSTVKLWDLRKLENFRTIQLEGRYEVKSLSFDSSGNYLAIGGTDIRLYHCKKTWNQLAMFDEHSGPVTGVAFGKNASYLVSASIDRHLKFYTAQ